MSGEGTTSLSAEIRRAIDRFNKRLAAKDPELMAKLAEMRGKKISVAIPHGIHKFTVEIVGINQEWQG